MMKTCKGKNSCGRTIDISLFTLSMGKPTSMCKECTNLRNAFYRVRDKPERIDHAQIARQMCLDLIEQKRIEDGK